MFVPPRRVLCRPGCRPLAVLLLALLAACGQPGAGAGRRPAMPTTITFASNVNADEEPALRRLLARFEESTKARIDFGFATRFRDESGIRVRLQPTTGEERLAALGSGEPGFQVFAEDIVALRPLLSFVQPLGGIEIPSEVDPDMTAALRFDGGDASPDPAAAPMFGPFRSNVRLQYGDKAKLREAGVVKVPTTPEEFETVISALKRAKPQGTPKATLSLSYHDDGAPSAVTISELILSQGGEPALLNDRGSVSAFELLRKWWQEGLLARESVLAKHDTEVGFLKEGVAALAQNWSFTSSELAKAGHLDRFEVHQGWGRHVIGGDALGIPKGVRGKEREAALKLVRFLMSYEAQRFLAIENSWASIRSDVRRALKSRSTTFAAIDAALEQRWYRPTASYWHDTSGKLDVTTAMNQALERVVLGTEPVKAILDELHEQVRRAHPDYPPKV